MNIRVQEFTARTMDRHGNLTGNLNGVTGGQINYSAQASIKSSGTIEVQDLGDFVDWLYTRIKIFTTIDGVTYPMGVFIPAAPEETYMGDGRSWSIEIVDKTSILANAALATAYTVPQGSNVVAAVAALIALSGEPPGAITPTSQVTRGDLSWEAGTPLLEVINLLLDSSNFFSLWCDGDGQYQVTPYQDAQTRPVMFEFVDDGDGESNYSPIFTRTENIYDTPNRFIGVTNSSEEEPALSAFAIIEDDTSRYSYANLGKWVDRVETGLEAEDQASLYLYCENKLSALLGASESSTISHLWEPININDVVRFRRSVAGIDGLHVVTRIEAPLTIHSEVTTTLRRVVEL